MLELILKKNFLLKYNLKNVAIGKYYRTNFNNSIFNYNTVIHY